MDGMPDLEKMIKNLSENEEFLNLVKTMKGESAGQTESSPAETEEKVQASAPVDISAAADKLPEIMSALGPLMKGRGHHGGGGSRDTENRNRLLAALKPYVNESRRDMIDKIMSLSKITGILDIMSDGKN